MSTQKKVIFSANTNPFRLDIPEYKIKYRKVRVSKLVYFPTTAGTQILFKIDTAGKLDQTLYYNDDTYSFFILPVLRDSALTWINYSNCNDWDYKSDIQQYLNSINFSFSENSTKLTTGYLATNPIQIELTIEE